MTEFWNNQITNLIGVNTGDLPKILSSVFIIILLWILFFLINSFVQSQSKSVQNRYIYRKITLYLLSFVGIILVGRLWLEGFQPILTFLGIIAAALTITQKESITNIFGVAFILGRDIFSIGDRIEVGNHKGDVIGIGIFYFTLMEIGSWVKADQSTGRTIKIPNGQVITTPIINYTKNFPYIWNEVTVLLTKDSNWAKTKNFLLNIAKKQSPKNMEEVKKTLKHFKDEVVILHHFDPKVYLKVSDLTPAQLNFLYDTSAKQETRGF